MGAIVGDAWCRPAYAQAIASARTATPMALPPRPAASSRQAYQWADIAGVLSHDQPLALTGRVR